MLVLILQIVERLFDRQAAEAVWLLIDWKYLLYFELTDPGFEYNILSASRTWMLENEWEEMLFDRLLVCIRDAGYPKNPGNSA
jgi:hypothetical protein